mgnify:CR=1 FL=1
MLSPTHLACPYINVCLLPQPSLDGGSVPFGGPQAADGEIKIFADHVLIPKERFTVKRVEFVNPQDSYLRLFAHSDNTNNDVGK